MNDIKSTISTIFERDMVLNFLDQFGTIVFNPSIDVKNYILQQCKTQNPELIASFLTQKGLIPDDLFSQAKLLKEELEGLVTITLTVPVPFDQQMLTRLTERARAITGLPVLLDTKVDPSILGGAVVEGQGRVGEFSLRKYFQERRNHGF